MPMKSPFVVATVETRFELIASTGTRNAYMSCCASLVNTQRSTSASPSVKRPRRSGSASIAFDSKSRGVTVSGGAASTVNVAVPWLFCGSRTSTVPRRLPSLGIVIGKEIGTFGANSTVFVVNDDEPSEMVTV